MQLVVGVIMARLLTPADYGITALPAIFMAVAGTLIDGGFGLALIRKPDLTEKDLSTSFYYNIGMGISLYLLLFISAPWIALFYETPILTKLIRITAIVFLINPIITPQNVILQRKLDFKTPARISIINKIISGALGIGIAYAGYGLWSLVVSGLASNFLGLIQTCLAVKWYPKEKFDKASSNYLWNFGNKMMLSGLIGTVYSNIAPLIIGKYFGTKDLGLYNRAYGYAALPYQQVTNTVKTVTFPVLSKLQHDDVLLANTYLRMIKAVCFVYFPFMMLLVGLARPLVIIMLTEKWEDSIILLQILSFVTIWGPLSALNGNILQVKGRSDLFLKLDLKKKAVGLAFTLCTLPFGLIAFCVGCAVSQLYVVYVNLKCVGEVVPLSLKKQMIEMKNIFLLSAVMLAVLLTFNWFVSNYWIQLFVGGTLGVSVYILLAYLLKMEEIQEVKFMVSRKQ